jgi:hypothetical protein
MDFLKNETQQMIAETIRTFGAKNITPYREKWDDDQFFWLHESKIGLLMGADILSSSDDDFFGGGENIFAENGS